MLRSYPYHLVPCPSVQPVVENSIGREPANDGPVEN